MRLTQPILGMFLQALLDSFDAAAMRVLLLQRYNKKFDWITSNTIWPQQATDVFEHFQFHNTVELLVALCRDARPAVPEFARVLDAMGFVVASDGSGAGTGVAGANGNLEALLSRVASPYQDVVAFRGNLSKLEGQVCRVTCGLSGTGILIAPDIVVTNRHVVRNVLADRGELTATVTCTFDDKKGDSTYTTPKKTVSVSKVIASSPHAAEDTKPGPPNASMEFLDYALLRLSERVGEQPIVHGGDERGWIDISEVPEAPALNSGLIVLQHPRAQPMKIDIGAVVENAPTRFRHTVNTERGSSGAPVFDAALKLAGLHHAGHETGPGGAPGFNQAIPFKLVLADARAKGAPL